MRGSSPIGERSATTGGLGEVCGPPCIPYRPLKHSLDSLSLSIVVEECKDLIWELRRRFLILVPEEAGIWCKTKFSVKHQGKDIHHPPSTIYKWPLSDLPRSTLCPSLSLSFTISLLFLPTHLPESGPIYYTSFHILIVYVLWNWIFEIMMFWNIFNDVFSKKLDILHSSKCCHWKWRHFCSF